LVTVRKLLWLTDLKTYLSSYINYVSKPRHLTARNFEHFNSKWVKFEEVTYNIAIKHLD
jgi:hypothetical protein